VDQVTHYVEIDRPIGTFDEFMALSVIDVLTMTTKSTQSIFFSTSAQARAKLQ
jgi:hypothetical protein